MHGPIKVKFNIAYLSHAISLCMIRILHFFREWSRCHSNLTNLFILLIV